jgi:hypothetical protein
MMIPLGGGKQCSLMMIPLGGGKQCSLMRIPLGGGKQRLLLQHHHPHSYQVFSDLKHMDMTPYDEQLQRLYFRHEVKSLSNRIAQIHNGWGYHPYERDNAPYDE